MIKNDSLSIVIVTWNNKEEISKCLNSLKRYPPNSEYSVWVIDNASTDGTIKLVEKSYPWVNLIKNSTNAGFSRANNQALKAINSEYVLLLNPDTQVTSSALDTLLNFLQKNLDTGAVGARLLNQDGSVQTEGYYRKLPSVMQVLLFYTNLYKLAQNNHWLKNRYWENDNLGSQPIEVEQIPGACLVMRHELLKNLGYLNEKYQIWFEDVDLCLKIRQQGLKLRLVPESQVYHIGGASFTKWNDSPKKEERFYQSLLVYFSINKSALEYLLVKTIILANLGYLIMTRTVKQLLTPTQDRSVFIRNKWEVLKCLLA